MAFGVRVRLVHEIDRGLAVDFDDDVLAVRGDLLLEPLVRLVRAFEDDQFRPQFGLLLPTANEPGIEAAGLDRVLVRGVDLGFVAGWEALLEPGPKILAAVSAVV